jgi:hypothetical protein
MHIYVGWHLYLSTCSETAPIRLRFALKAIRIPICSKRPASGQEVIPVS